MKCEGVLLTTDCSYSSDIVAFASVQHVPQFGVCVCVCWSIHLGACVCSCTVSWYLAKSV